MGAVLLGIALPVYPQEFDVEYSAIKVQGSIGRSHVPFAVEASCTPVRKLPRAAIERVQYGFAADGSDTRCVLTHVSLRFDETSVHFPKSSFEDLADVSSPGSLGIEYDGDNLTLSLHGGDGAAAYTARFLIRDGRLLAREIEDIGEAGELRITRSEFEKRGDAIQSSGELLTPSPKGCKVPPGLSEELSKKYPSARVVQLPDLDDYHRKLFQRDHGSRCPGLVDVNFYGDGEPTWAIVLIEGPSPKRKASLLVARQIAGAWEIRSLEQTDGTPVVWREAPGEYEGYEGTVLRAANPVIVFCGYESWAIAYAWTGKKVEKVWLTD